MPRPPKNRGTSIDRVAAKLGMDFVELSAALGVSRFTPHGWNRYGGHIPGRFHAALIKIGKKRKKKITAKDLVNL